MREDTEDAVAPVPERVPRGELLDAVTRALQDEMGAGELLTVDEAEAIAAEVGVGPDELAEALAGVRRANAERAGFLGAGATIYDEVRIGEKSSDGAEELAAVAAALGVPPTGGDRRNALRLVRRGGHTYLSASLDRARTKVALLAGGSAVGSLLGVFAAGVVSIGLSTPIEMSALNHLIGLIAGAGGGLGAGVGMWRATRARLQAQLRRVLGGVEGGAS